MTSNKAFAEVVESSLQGFTAQSWSWDSFPTFGSMVTITTKKRIIFGLVHQIHTGSMDQTRYPFPYQKTEEELQREQPQIFAFLKTTFSCLPIGYQENGILHYLLPPEPAKIHAFVAPMTDEASKQFFYKERYLHVLFGLSNTVFNLDELLLALLNYQASRKMLTPDKISSFAQRLSLLTGNDYRRLKLFLQRVEPILENHSQK